MAMNAAGLCTPIPSPAMVMPIATAAPPSIGSAIRAQPATTNTCPITSCRPGSRCSGAATTEPIVHATVAATSGTAVSATLQPAPDCRSRTTNACEPMNATPVASTRIVTRRPARVDGKIGPLVRCSCQRNSRTGTTATFGSTSSARVASASRTGPAGARRAPAPMCPTTPRVPASASDSVTPSGTSSTANTHRQPGSRGEQRSEQRPEQRRQAPDGGVEPERVARNGGSSASV